MLSIFRLRDARRAKIYYQEGDYYTDGKDAVESSWCGTGAQRLGFKGTVAKDDFELMLKGKIPNGQTLGRKIKGELCHTPGWDLTFSAPKSVSILALAARREEIRQAHLRAVKTALNFIEKNLAITRRYCPQSKRQIEVPTGSLVAATFVHETSRALDPQLHSHAVILNATAGDEHWRSLVSKPFYQNKMLVGQIYRNELAGELRSLGYSIRPAGRNGEFEIEGVPKDLIELFSKRSRGIRKAARNGKDATAKELERVALVTRSSKLHAKKAWLQASWIQEASEGGYSIERWPRPSTTPTNKKLPCDIVAKALSHLQERSAVFSRSELALSALQFGLGSITISDVEETIADFEAEKRIIRGTASPGIDLYTTPVMAALEADTLRQMQSGWNSSVPIESLQSFRSENAPQRLTTGQALALTKLVTSEDRFVAVQGSAGSGKTTLMKSVKTISEDRGWIVEGLAPQASAASKLQEESGIQSGTLQWFLTKYAALASPKATNAIELDSLRRKFRKTMLICDEASFVSTRQMQKFLAIANKLKVGRVALVGDTKQLDGVEAGCPFHLLQRGGIEAAEMKENMRQKSGRHRDAVIALRDGDIQTAFKNLRGEILEGGDKDYAIAAVDAWLAMPDETRAKTLLISPTHAIRHSMTDWLRSNLLSEGKLGSEALNISSLTPEKLTGTQLRLADAYREGQIVRFNRDYKTLDISSGSMLTVVRINSNAGEVILMDGERQIQWKPSRIAAKTSGAVEVFEPRDIELREGDQVRFTRNIMDRGIKRNVPARIANITESTIEFEFSEGRRTTLKRDDQELRFLDHNWTATVHSAQGQSVEQVIGVVGSNQRFSANQKMFYVELSRIRTGVQIFTDDALQLRAALEDNTGQRISALELKPSASEKTAHEAETILPAPVVPDFEHMQRYLASLVEDERELELSLW